MAGMILKYRGEAHAAGECGITEKRVPAFGERGRRIGIKRVWTNIGFLTAASQSLLLAAREDLIDRYSEDGGNLILYLPDGTTEVDSLMSNDSLGGTRVVEGPHFTNYKGAELVNFVNYQIVVDADFAESSENLLTWSQQFSYKGVAGAEKWVYVATLNGDWQRQTVNQRTPVTVVQHGSAVGQFSYPVPPAPMWPNNEHMEQRVIDPKDPKEVGDDLTNWEIAWSYTFESIVAL